MFQFGGPIVPAGSRSLLAGTLKQNKDITTVITFNHITASILNKKKCLLCEKCTIHLNSLEGSSSNLSPSFSFWPQNKLIQRRQCCRLASHVYKRFFEIDTDPRSWYRSKNYGYAQEWWFLGVNIFTLCLWRPHNGQKAQQNGGGSEIPLKSTVMSCQLKRNLRGRQHLNHPPVPHDVIVATGWKWMKPRCEWLEGTGPPEPLADAKQAHESWREVPEHTHTSLPAAALLF